MTETLELAEMLWF